MIVAMWFGMSRAFGTVPYPFAWAVNLALIVQFPLGHSLFLSRAGNRALARLAPANSGKTLATTTYALIASLQLAALFVFWTPTGTIWWRAEGPALWAMSGLYASSWLLLMKASFDAGAEVQSGLLGWVSLARGVRPQFPPMPKFGLFRFVRHPIYLAFTLTLWTVPTWTPDQLVLAISFTLYCTLAPILKERRYQRMFGAEFETYRTQTPYFVPRAPIRQARQEQDPNHDPA